MWFFGWACIISGFIAFLQPTSIVGREAVFEREESIWPDGKHSREYKREISHSPRRKWRRRKWLRKKDDHAKDNELTNLRNIIFMQQLLQFLDKDQKTAPRTPLGFDRRWGNNFDYYRVSEFLGSAGNYINCNDIPAYARRNQWFGVLFVQKLSTGILDVGNFRLNDHQFRPRQTFIRGYNRTGEDLRQYHNVPQWRYNNSTLNYTIPRAPSFLETSGSIIAVCFPIYGYPGSPLPFHGIYEVFDRLPTSGELSYVPQLFVVHAL